MEELDFGRIRIDVEESKHSLRVCGFNENQHINRMAPDNVTHNFEQICRDRFPNALNEHHTLKALLQPTDKDGHSIELTWEAHFATLEASQKLWYSKKKPFRVFTQSAGKEGKPDECFGRDYATRRGDLGQAKFQKKAVDKVKSVGVAVNQYFAAILCQYRPKLSLFAPDVIDKTGELSFMSLLSYRQDSSWKRSGIEVDYCKAAFFEGSTLYLIDGDKLRAITVFLEVNQKMSYHQQSLDIKENLGIELGDNVLSISANSLYVLVTGKVFGWLLFGIVDGLLQFRKRCPAEVAGNKTVGAVSGHGFMLGTQDRNLETWEIRPADATVVMLKTEKFLIARQSTSSGNLLMLTDPNDIQIKHLHYSPGRIAVACNRNSVEFQMRPDPVMFQNSEPKASPVIAQAVFGELCATLYRSGVASVRQFASGQTLQTFVGPVLSFNQVMLTQMPAKQWIAMTHDTVFCLVPDGHIWFWHVTDRIITKS